MNPPEFLYLDHNATTPLCSDALEAMRPHLEEQWGNPSSIHAMGVRARDAVEAARERIAEVLGVRSSEIVFTSGGTESIHLAHHGAALAARGRRRLITSQVEHSATVEVLDRLAAEGSDVERVGVDTDGRLLVDRYRAALDDRVFLVSLIAANNETGVRFNLDELGLAAQEVGATFHTDAVQLAGKGFSRLGDRPIDMASFAAHKFGGPKGSGFLWVKRGTRLRPTMSGGHQERGRRGGTENVAGIVGMAAALESTHRRWRVAEAGIASLRDQLQARVQAEIPEVLIIGADADRVANTLCFCVRGIEGAAIVLTMSSHGVMCSSGSACLATADGPSHVLEAMDVPGDYIHGAVRISLGLESTHTDIDRAMLALTRSVDHLRRINL